MITTDNYLQQEDHSYNCDTLNNWRFNKQEKVFFFLILIIACMIKLREYLI